jgi:TFIIF-interacting CTD phosphatase-like protein
MRSRYKYGVVEMNHKGKKVTTNVGTSFDDMVASADDKVYRTARLLQHHEGRSDSLSVVFYDTPQNWWYVQHINNMNDPLQQLTKDSKIRIPNV